jgi:hypothetical protein
MLVALGYTLWAKRKNRLDPHEIRVKNRKEWITALWTCTIGGWIISIVCFLVDVIDFPLVF